MAAETTTAQLAALRAAEISAATARLEELECPVCREQREDLTNPPCQHTCCLPCLTEAHGRKPQCPTCRTKIPVGVMRSLQINPYLRDEVRRLTSVVYPNWLLVRNLIAALEPDVPLPTLVAAAQAVIDEDAPSFPRNVAMEEALEMAYGAARLPARIAARQAYRIVTHAAGNWLDDVLALLGCACERKNEALIVSCIAAMRDTAEWYTFQSPSCSLSSTPSRSIFRKLDMQCSKLHLALDWVETKDAVSGIEDVLVLVLNVAARSVACMAWRVRQRLATSSAASANPAPVSGVKRSAAAAGLPPVGSSSASSW